MRDDNCIFCKIANGEIPSATLYEDEDFRVILDLGPATKGHALILPKNHFANLFEIPEDMDAKAFILAKKIAKKMKDVFGISINSSNNINIVSNDLYVTGENRLIQGILLSHSNNLTINNNSVILEGNKTAKE